jgi:hypothetical protein
MKSYAVLAALVCATLAACEGADVAAPVEDGTLMQRLQAPTTLEIDAEASLLALNATTDQSEDTMPIEFTIVDGVVDIRADERGDIIVHEFEFGLEDVSISADLFPPDGLELREMHVRMEYPVVASPEWTTTSASAEIAMDITADWSAVFNDNVYSLKSIELRDLIVQADLSLVDGEITAQVSGVRAGTFWDWANRFEMSDLVVEVDARAR